MYIYFCIIFILLCYLFTFIFSNNNISYPQFETSDTDLSENDYYTAYNNEHSLL